MSDTGWTLTVPQLDVLTEVINKHLHLVMADGPIPEPDHNVELELFGGLLGQSRIIEINVRVALELLSKKSPRSLKYARVLQVLENGLVPTPDLKVGFELLRRAARASGGLAHGDFPTVEAAVKSLRADFPDFDFRRYPPQKLFTTTLTQHGVNLDASTGSAKDNLGNPVPAESHHDARKSKTYEENFKAFYQSGAFVNVAELLREAYQVAVKLREDIRRLPPPAKPAK